jgi:hypothetical protein
MYRFGRQRGGLPIDPRVQTEDIGDDAVRASGYGIANLKRVIPEPRRLDLHARRGLRRPGGAVRRAARPLQPDGRPRGGQRRRRARGREARATSRASSTSPCRRARQREAVRFLAAHVFDTPTWLNDREILARLEHAGAVERIRQLQVRTTSTTCSSRSACSGWWSGARRGERGLPAGRVHGRRARTRCGASCRAAADRPYRRNLQRGHLARWST